MIVDCHTHIHYGDDDSVSSEHLAASETVDVCVVLATAAESSQKINQKLCEYIDKHKEKMVGLAVLEGMLAPYLACGKLSLWLEHKPVRAEVTGDRVDAVTLLDLRSSQERTVTFRYVLDATELGNLLPLAGVEFVIGA